MSNIDIYNTKIFEIFSTIREYKGSKTVPKQMHREANGTFILAHYMAVKQNELLETCRRQLPDLK